MFINILKFKLLIYISRALFLLIASFYIGIIIGFLLAAYWISIVIILYNFDIPSYLIAFNMLAGGQYATVEYGSTKLPVIIYLVGAVLFV